MRQVSHAPLLHAVLLLLVALQSTTAYASVVYDNTTGHTSGIYAPDGIWELSRYAPYEEIGDEVTLGGTDRLVTEFELLLSSSSPTVVTRLTLSFWLNDGLDVYTYPGAPGTLVWSGIALNVAFSGDTTVIFSVPYVLVPDSFTWTASGASTIAGMVTCNSSAGPGSSADAFWDHDVYDHGWYPSWFGSSPVANFGARVTAVPEPLTGSLLLIGGWSLSLRRRVGGRDAVSRPGQI